MKYAIVGAVLTILTLVIPAFAGDLKEFGCGKVVETPNGFPQLVSDGQLHVLDQTNRSTKFDPGTAPQGTTIKAIFCSRSDIVPAASDYKVVQAGYPLTIFARDTDNKNSRTRIAVLELNEGQLRMRSVGEPGFTSDMIQRIQAFLDASLPQFGKTVIPR